MFEGVTWKREIGEELKAIDLEKDGSDNKVRVRGRRKCEGEEDVKLGVLGGMVFHTRIEM